MILPTKYLNENETLLNVGAIILKHLGEDSLLSKLWENVKLEPSVGNYERFVLALDLLYILGAVEIKNNKMHKVNK